jgi:hypothetical protein
MIEILLKNRNVLWLLFLGFYSCAKEITYELPEIPPRLVLNANAIDGEQLTAYVSYSIPNYLSDTVISDFAPVVLLEQKGNPLETLTPVVTSIGTYYRSTNRIAKGAYSISVSAPGFESITANTTVPGRGILEPFNLDPNTHTTVMSGPDTLVLRVPLRIGVKNLAETDSLFALRVEYSTMLSSGEEKQTRANFIAEGDVFANLHESLNGVFVVNKKMWENNPDRSFTVDILMPFSPAKTKNMYVNLEWRTISPEFYKYHISLSRQNSTLVPFGIPAVIYNNVINGYGNFSGYYREFIPPLKVY